MKVVFHPATLPQYNLLNRDLSKRHLHFCFPVLEDDISKARGSGKKSREIAGCCFYIEGLIHGIIADARMRFQQCIAGEGPGVPIAGLVLIKGISNFPIVPVPAGANDVQSFFYAPLEDQMGGHLVFHACPYFVAVDKG